jgi:hypothetical protein
MHLIVERQARSLGKWMQELGQRKFTLFPTKVWEKFVEGFTKSCDEFFSNFAGCPV